MCVAVVTFTLISAVVGRVASVDCLTYVEISGGILICYSAVELYVVVAAMMARLIEKDDANGICTDPAD